MSGASGSFIDKQLGREPGWRLLPVFAKGLGQDWLPAWAALLGELDETIFERSDPRVAQTKLAWWGTDLGAGQRAQHPLSRELLGAAGAAAIDASSWQLLAHEALRMALVDETPGDWAAAGARWEALATRVAMLESALCGIPVAPACVALQWRRQRLWHALLRDKPAQSLAPLGWQAALARGDSISQLWQQFADAEAGNLAIEQAERLPLHRALLRCQWQWRLDRLRRDHGVAGAMPPGPARLLWRSWRTAMKLSRR